MSESGYLEVGRFGSVYGVRGWIRIISETENPENVFTYSPWLLRKAGGWRSIQLSEWKRHNEGYICKIEGISDREQAKLLTGQAVFVTEDVLPPLQEGEYYWRDLIGLSVVNTAGYALGVVDDLMDTGSNSVLIVRAEERDAFGKKERLIPVINGRFVKGVDFGAKVITVDWDPDF